MRRFLKFIVSIFTAAALVSGCRQAAVTENIPAATQEPVASKEAVTILYTNDIHSFIYNMTKGKDGSEIPGIRLSRVAAYRDQLAAEGKHVLLVDSGDEIQGSVYGVYDQGETVIKLMNAAGYQAMAVGNHEFDYGVDRLRTLSEQADYPFLSCTFRNEKGELVFEPTKILETGGVKIGFVGATTPATITTSTPTFFQNAEGNFIYSFDGNEKKEDLYASVQQAVDSVRDEVDYVIVLGHLGCGLDEKNAGISSYDVIANTTGIDVVLDGHSHTTMEKELVKNKDGQEVLLTQTGAYLAALGQLEISADGKIDSHLITEGLEEADELVAAAEDAYDAAIMAAMGQKIATLDTTLYIYDADNEKRRLVRARETSLGDFASDSVYWYFNEKLEIPCDVVLTNGGGLRTNLPAGDISMLEIKSVRPFNNQICMIRATGQQILDALEMGARLTGQWDAEWDCPAENGGFMQVAGIRYTVDAAIPSGVVLNEKGDFVEVSGPNRVTEVSVYNRETGQYEALDRNRIYTVGSINFLLRSGGDGFTMFEGTEGVVDFVGTDDSVLTSYVVAFQQKDDYPEVCTENSPLKAYENYQLDYENPSGAGRITMLNLEK